MNSFYRKLVVTFFSLLFVTVLTVNLLSLDDGITGLTRKNGGVGCVCHGENALPDTTVHVFFVGPDSVGINQSAYYQLRIVGGPHVAAGLDVAVGHGTLDTAGWETGTRTQWQQYGFGDSALEVTHNVPKVFVGDTMIFSFKYRAPSTAGYDTLFGNGNSVNGNDTDDQGDRWNFAPNRRIRIYVPIGIENLSEVASDYSLGQNYPNPFNPSTNIIFSIKKENIVQLDVYDITGRRVSELVNRKLKPGEYKVDFDASSLPSGAYFYRIRAGDFVQTKKMILIK